MVGACNTSAGEVVEADMIGDRGRKDVLAVEKMQNKFTRMLHGITMRLDRLVLFLLEQRRSIYKIEGQRRV